MNTKLRNAWLRSLPRWYCWVCESAQRLTIHHIERRSHAKEPDQECNLFLACLGCHGTDLATMPHARQLAYKQIHDPEHYDLAQWLLVRNPDGSAPLRVTQDEVDQHVQQLREATA